jgi:hypothetical protein
MTPVVQTSTNSRIQEEKEYEQEQEEDNQVSLSVDVTTLEVSTKVKCIQESAELLAKGHYFNDLSVETYLSGFESPEAWEEIPEEERHFYSHTWFLKYLQSRCGLGKVNPDSLKYYEIADLRTIKDREERRIASDEKKRLREMARTAFKRFQEHAYLSSSNKEVAKAAAEKKEAVAKARRDAAAAKVCSN